MSGSDADFGEAAEAGLFNVVEFGQRVVYILALLAQVLTLLVDALHQKLQLAEFARWLLVDLDDLANLRDGETDPPPAQDFADQPSVGRPEETGAPAPLRMDQSFVFVDRSVRVETPNSRVSSVML